MTDTLLVHSGAGVAALIVGLRCIYDDERMLTELPRQWPAISRPGRFICLYGPERGGGVVCMNSGTTGGIAQRLMEGAAVIWGAQHLRPLLAKEGPFCRLRFLLFAHFPKQKWLLRYELAREYSL